MVKTQAAQAVLVAGEAGQAGEDAEEGLAGQVVGLGRAVQPQVAGDGRGEVAVEHLEGPAGPAWPRARTSSKASPVRTTLLPVDRRPLLHRRGGRRTGTGHRTRQGGRRYRARCSCSTTSGEVLEPVEARQRPAHAVVAGEPVAGAVQEGPVAGGERAGVLPEPLPRVVPAAAAVVAHPVDVGARRRRRAWWPAPRRRRAGSCRRRWRPSPSRSRRRSSGGTSRSSPRGRCRAAARSCRAPSAAGCGAPSRPGAGRPARRRGRRRRRRRRRGRRARPAPAACAPRRCACRKSRPRCQYMCQM